MNRLIRTFVAVITAITVAGCAPVYKTQYSYSELVDTDTKACVLECGNARLACKEAEHRDYAWCVDEARWDEYRYRSCMSHYDDTSSRRINCFRPSNFCFRPNYENCEIEYAGCFERCGGEVTREQICVANCDNQ